MTLNTLTLPYRSANDDHHANDLPAAHHPTPDSSLLFQPDPAPVYAAKAYATTYAQDHSHVIQGDVVHHHYYPSNSNIRHFPASIPLEWQQSNKYDLLVDSLKYARINARALNIEDAAHETCKWLPSHTYIHDWISDNDDESHHGLLWIKGKPGSGKSTIMKLLLEQTTKRPQDVTISYFFNARALTDLEKSSQGLYRSLTLQILTKINNSYQDFATRFWSKVTGDAVDSWTSTELQGFITHVIADPHHPPINLFVDALDEGPEADVRPFIAYLERLVIRCRSTSARLRICLASRHFPHITIRYGRHLVLDKEPEHDKDVSAFVQQSLIVDSEDLRGKICRKSAGIFLWVVLTVPMLNTEYDQGVDIEELENILENLPADLNELFDNILRASKASIDKCVTLLQWVLFSHLPLSPQDLYVALHFSDATLPSTVSTVPDDERVQKYILHRSRGLVEVVQTDGQQVVQFIHDTVRAFLLGPDGLCKLQSDLAEQLEGKSHDKLKRVCFDFIKHHEGGYKAITDQVVDPVHRYVGQSISRGFWPGFDRDVDGFEVLPPFAEYVLSMMIHADSAQEHGIDQGNWLTELSGSDALQLWCKLYVFTCSSEIQDHELAKNMCPTAVAAHLGLRSLMSCLVSSHPTDNFVTQSSIMAALKIACRNADPEIIRIIAEANRELLELPEVRRNVLDSLFRGGVYTQNDELLDYVQTECGFSVSESDVVGRVRRWKTSKLHWRQLMKMGVKLECCDEMGVTMSSLIWKWALNAADLVELASAGFDLDAVSTTTGGALQAACLQNNGVEDHNVNLLLATGCDPNVQGGHYGNALQAACSHPNPTMALDLAKILLTAGANVNAVGGVWGSALQAAAGRTSTDLILLLLDNGADVNVSGRLRNGALEAICHASLGLLARAFSERNTGKVQLLLNAASSIDERQAPFEIALRAAILSRNNSLVEQLCGHYGGPPETGLELSEKNVDAGGDSFKEWLRIFRLSNDWIQIVEHESFDHKDVTANTVNVEKLSPADERLERKIGARESTDGDEVDIGPGATSDSSGKLPISPLAENEPDVRRSVRYDGYNPPATLNSLDHMSFYF